MAATVKLKSRIPQITASIPIRVGAAIHKGAEGIAEAAAERAPDRPPTGQYLKNEITVHSDEFVYGGRSRFSTVAGGLGFSSPIGKATVTEVGYGIWAPWYWEFVENGTSRAAPHPFMMPAAEAGTPEIAALATAALRGL